MYSVDPERIYVAGESMGGFGAWDALSRHPDVFAAAVPTDGGGSPKAAPRLKNRVVFSAHFARDGSVPASSDREMFLAVARAGGRPTYVEVDVASHGVAGAVVGSPGFFDWLYAQRLGVVATVPPPLLAIAPWGATSAQPVSVAIAGRLSGSTLRTTTDGQTPTSASPAYAGSFMVTKSAVVMAGLFQRNDDGDVTVFQAAPFMIAGQPLPGGVVLGPDAGGNGGAGASGNSGAGGASGGASGASGGASGGGASGGGAGAVAIGGSGGDRAGGGTAGNAGASGGRSGGGGSSDGGDVPRGSSGGCRYGAADAVGFPAIFVLLGLLTRLRARKR
jgi:hypothetical protein